MAGGRLGVFCSAGSNKTGWRIKSNQTTDRGFIFPTLLGCRELAKAANTGTELELN